VTATAAAALHGLLDAPGPPPAAGEPVPPLWHWLAFLPDAPQRELGSDGHPRLGSFLPPSRLPRRMYAGGRIELALPIAIGEPIHRRSVVSSVTEKSGRSGDLLFVEVTHELSCDSQSSVTETQDLVYRPASPTASPAASPTASPATSPTASAAAPAGAASGSAVPSGGIADPGADDQHWAWRLELSTDPTLLFRFSALTYNAHRIHYDRAFSTEVEGYPGLVVHGPLQAIALAELCRRNAPDRCVATFTFRALRPAFDGSPLELRGRLRDEDHGELVAFDRDGRRTMTADVALYPHRGVDAR
jgi:3-methylfumaryl-CoA hydratase